MNSEEFNEIMACWRCGSRQDDGHDEDDHTCEECGEEAAYTINGMIDIINDNYLNGRGYD